jgi:uncharacterized protein (DUF58 family)
MLKNLFLHRRLFAAMGALAVLFVFSFAFPPLFLPAKACALVLAILIIADALILFHFTLPLSGNRQLPTVFSLGDPNPVAVHVQNTTPLTLYGTLIDELPFQFQIRDFEQPLVLPPGSTKVWHYQLSPKLRGEYAFGHVYGYVSTALSLLQRRVTLGQPTLINVLPSIIQMKKFELRSFNRMAQFHGLKRLRRIGHSYEFDQIKNYVRGDDYRSVNWKASSRRSELMVNQYEDERAQQIYCVIDKSRTMKMPFDGMSLLDYAINTSLVIANIALQKHDKAGLISFSDKIGTTLKADNKSRQLHHILTALSKEKERNTEANYELLYHASRKLISGRSLLLLFTNFESSYALDRVVPILRQINKSHLLVVIFFENTEISTLATQAAHTVEDIYRQTVAQQFIAEKTQMVHQLRQYGIQSILSSPNDLSIHTINKYLEMKSKGLI